MDDSLSSLDRIKEEIADSFDEELEMEMDESRLETLLAELRRGLALDAHAEQDHAADELEQSVERLDELVGGAQRAAGRSAA